MEVEANFEKLEIIQEGHHFRVVRSYAHAGHGLIEETLGENLSLSEAEEVIRQHPRVVSDEDIAVIDDSKTGLEAIMKPDFW